MAKIKDADLKKDVIPHVRNINKGSERGSIQIEESLKSYGAGRSIVTDKNGVIIAGNHVAQGAAELGLKAVEIETDGDTLVIVKRKDLDLADAKDKRAVELAFADNRTRDVSAGQFDKEILEAEMREGADFSKFIRDDELEEQLKEEEKKAKKGEPDSVLVKLNFRAAHYVEFCELVKVLMTRWGLEDTPEAVLEALRRAEMQQ